MRVQIITRPKATILDPAGRTIEGALHGLGYGDVTSVRQGKSIEIEIACDSKDKAKAMACEMAEALLTNPLLEDFEVKLLD